MIKWGKEPLTIASYTRIGVLVVCDGDWLSNLSYSSVVLLSLPCHVLKHIMHFHKRSIKTPSTWLHRLMVLKCRLISSFNYWEHLDTWKIQKKKKKDFKILNRKNLKVLSYQSSIWRTPNNFPDWDTLMRTFLAFQSMLSVENLATVYASSLNNHFCGKICSCHWII